MTRLLALVACLLTVCITASSAFIRHAQNGLGCVDWPACYRTAAPGRAGADAPPDGTAASATPATTASARADTAAPSAAPARVDSDGVRVARSLHRVSATLVGLLVLFVAVLGWSKLRGGGRLVAVTTVLVTAFLAWLGRYTPHDLPLVTVGNLLGGLLLAAALAWLAAALESRRPGTADDGVAAARSMPGALLALVLLALLATGGAMIGARHAIAACTTPWCASGASLALAAFDPTRAAVPLDAGAAQGLHIAHRLVALAFAFAVGFLALGLRRTRPALAAALVLLVVVQALLGMATAMGPAPLLTATLHNAVAALLAVALGALAGAAARTDVARIPRSRTDRPLAV